ncbi:MAG: protein kinase domain-containing protein [Gemmatimonadales bacterium]
MPAPTSCAVCGSPLGPGERFCGQCGSDTESQSTDLLTAPLDTASLPLNEDTLPLLLRQATSGDYEIRRELGRGAMATVFLARDVHLGRDVAVKVMSPALVSGHGTVERFLREARTVAALSHPHIIPIHLIRRRGDLIFFVMQYVSGRPLDEVMEAGPLPIPTVTRILDQVSSALAYAHRQGVIHRDIKPANVMLDADGNAIVTDFGIAKLPEGQPLTQTGALVGTPAYMSPEQCAAAPVTGASDQYCLGVMAYEMLAGRLPFDGETFMAVLYQHLHDAPQPIAHWRPDCPPAIEAIVLRMLEKEPARRWQSLDDVRRSISVAPLEVAAPATAARTPRRSGARRMILAAGGVVGVLTLSAGWALTHRAPAVPAPAPGPTAADSALRNAAQVLLDSAAARNAHGDYHGSAIFYDSARGLARKLGAGAGVLLQTADSGAAANASGCRYEATLRGGRGGALSCPPVAADMH